MKKHNNIITLFFVFLLFSGNLLYAEKINLLSFNMGAKGRTANKIADMIAESGADIVFLQEVWVKHPENAALNRMLKRLGNNWDFVTSSSYALMEMRYVGEESYKTGGYAQNNAIVYNRKKLVLANLADEVGFSDFSGDYLFDKNNVQLVAFKLVDGKEDRTSAYDLYAINVHLPYNDYQHRIRDLETLEKLYAKYKHNAALVIAGDFNLNRSALTVRNFDFVDGSKRWYSDPNYGIATTVSPSKKSGVFFVNDYDHFIYNRKTKVVEEMHRLFAGGKNDSARKTDFDGRGDSSSGRGKFCEELIFGNESFSSGSDYREAISDHVPIMITIELD
jgi:endonuclease/exonuclease/phosphatase family metal-dependent hydrolase